MPISRAVAEALSQMTSTQIENLIQTARQSNPPVEMATMTTSSKGKKKANRGATSGKAIRPLNSWIAFRSYYSAAFPKFQQKDISGFLKSLWESDPFKAKWSLLAKAYSIIRDSKGKDNVHLDKFLALTGPLIGIIKPEKYLQATGWMTIIQENGQASMKRVGSNPDGSLSVTNQSVNDIIRYCYQQGFFTGSVADLLSSSNEVVMTMATSTQNRGTSLPSTAIQVQGSSTQVMGVATSEAYEDQTYDPKGQQSFVDSSVQKNANKKSTAKASTTTGSTSPSSAPMTGTMSDTNMVSYPVIHPHAALAAVNPASSLSAANFQLALEYPYNSEFDPDLPGFVFDPFLGDQFDVFDMSDMTWADVVDFEQCE